MIDINDLRENPEKYKKGTAAKQIDPSIVDELLKLDKKRRELLVEVEELRGLRNKAAKAKDIESGKEIKTKLQKIEPGLAKVEEVLQDTVTLIPNPPAEDVAEGKDERENEVERTVGKKKKFTYNPKDHLEIGEALGIIDMERGSKVSGARFTYLKGAAVLLEFALVQYALDVLVEEGFVPVVPPALIKKEMMAGMGYMEHGGEEDMYVLAKDNLVLVGTSEQAIGPMHAGEVLSAKDLPLRYVGFSSCFRREAGSYGKDTKGILRLHQFDKVEMFSVTKAEDGDKEHEYLLELEEKLMKSLALPYQVIKMCSGDLGAPAARKYDLNVWLPGQGKYRELTSASTTTDFQARRLNIKYRDGSENKLVHMLNGTGFAIGRTIIAILENYQQKDGSVEIPKVLQKYMGKKKITPQ